MKSILKTGLLLGFVFAGWMATSAVIDHERSVSIMFNPETDGPLRIEEKPHYSIAMGSGGACLTTMAFAGGSQAMPVYTPCSGGGGSGASVYSTITGGGGGGGSVHRTIEY